MPPVKRTWLGRSSVCRNSLERILFKPIPLLRAELYELNVPISVVLCPALSPKMRYYFREIFLCSYFFIFNFSISVQQTQTWFGRLCFRVPRSHENRAREFGDTNLNSITFSPHACARKHYRRPESTARHVGGGFFETPPMGSFLRDSVTLLQPNRQLETFGFRFSDFKTNFLKIFMWFYKAEHGPFCAAS